MSMFVDDAASCSDDDSSVVSTVSDDVTSVGSTVSEVVEPGVVDPAEPVGDDAVLNLLEAFGIADGSPDVPKSKKSRNYVFTLNNYSMEEELALRRSDEMAKLRYICFGREKGTRNGTHHLQGVLVFHSACSFTAVKKYLWPVEIPALQRAYFAMMRGTPEQASAYCKKDGDVYEFGDMPVSAKRKGEMEKERWTAAIRLAQEGKFEDLIDNSPDIYLRYSGGLEFARKRYLDTRPIPNLVGALNNVWIFGAAGFGKSRRARRLFEDIGEIYYEKDVNKWWDGFEDHDNIIVDDWDPSHEKLHTRQLKVWTDRYPFRAEIKKTSRRIRPKRAVVTSNFSMDECWESLAHRGALTRRFRQEQMQPPESGGPYVFYPDEYVSYRSEPHPHWSDVSKVWEVIDKERFDLEHPDGLEEAEGAVRI